MQPRPALDASRRGSIWRARETEREVAAHWRAVEAVAAALLERERLEALEIYKIIVKARWLFELLG
jgi:hypothetical protein